MKTLKLVLTLVTYLALGWLSVGCGHAQVAPTSFQVDLSWTAPVAAGSWPGCSTSAPCTYVMSRIAVAAGTTSCPSANTTTPNYAPINQATPAGGTTFVDTAAVGLTVCYVVQTEQASAVSQPSNTAGPIVVPASPLAPTLGTPTAVADALPAPSGDSTAPVLSAKLTPVR